MVLHRDSEDLFFFQIHTQTQTLDDGEGALYWIRSSGTFVVVAGHARVSMCALCAQIFGWWSSRILKHFMYLTVVLSAPK